jgi:hypothetical protein
MKLCWNAISGLLLIVLTFLEFKEMVLLLT